jgi:hypothetical protein
MSILYDPFFHIFFYTRGQSRTKHHVFAFHYLVGQIYLEILSCIKLIMLLSANVLSVPSCLTGHASTAMCSYRFSMGSTMFSKRL